MNEAPMEFEFNRILQGNCLDIMKGMAAGMVDCCVTSPPY